MRHSLALEDRAFAPTISEYAPSARRQPAAPGLLRFLTCGSVDDGKSTFIGRLLYDCRLVHDDQLAALERDSRRYGTQGTDFDFALLVDGLSAEREQGITIDVAYRYFATARRSFVVADAPGHEQYTRNMATGASTADLAVILVDARKGLAVQTRRHAFIAAMLGIRHVVLAVNKMDLVGYAQATFDRISSDFLALTRPLGFAGIVSIPIAAKSGENVSSRAPTMPWYRGPLLLEHLETVEVAGEADETFRLPVQWVSRPNSEFRGYCGFVASGSVVRGAPVTVQPGGRRSRVKDVRLADRRLDKACAGQSVTLILEDEIDISRGDVIVSHDDGVQVTTRADAYLLWMADAPLQLGASYMLKLGTRSIAARITHLHHKVNVFDYAPVAAETAAANDLVQVTVAFEAQLPVVEYRRSRELGGFILIDRLTNDTAAIGLIERPLQDAPPTGEQGGPTRPAILPRLGNGIAAWLVQARERPLRSIAKAITWRTTGSLDTFILSLIFTGSATISAAISASEIATKLFLYYGHERLWARSKFGLSRPTRDKRQAEVA